MNPVFDNADGTFCGQTSDRGNAPLSEKDKRVRQLEKNAKKITYFL